MSDPVLTVNVVAPAAGLEIGDQIEVRGGLSVAGGGDVWSLKKVELWVSVDDGGPSVRAALNGTGFQCTRPVQTTTSAGTPLPGGTQLTVTVSAQVLLVKRQDPQHPNQDPDTSQLELEAEASVRVVYSQRPPQLSVVVPEWVTFPAPVQVVGTASDDAGLSSVQYSVDGAAFADVDNPLGSWNPWSKTLSPESGGLPVAGAGDGCGPALLRDRAVGHDRDPGGLRADRAGSGVRADDVPA